MSALGQNQTFAMHQPMSALLPKATSKVAGVRLGPTAVIVTAIGQGPYAGIHDNQRFCGSPSTRNDLDFVTLRRTAVSCFMFSLYAFAFSMFGNESMTANFGAGPSSGMTFWVRAR